MGETSKKQEVLRYIEKYLQQHQYPPSVREICSGVELKSTSSVHNYIIQLKNDGLIESDHDFCPRCIRLKNWVLRPNVSE